MIDSAQNVQHVLDSSASNLEEQRQAVLDVLRQIGVSGKKIQDMVEVWNKVVLILQSVQFFLSFFRFLSFWIIEIIMMMIKFLNLIWTQIDIQRDTDTETETGVSKFDDDSDYKFEEDEDEVADDEDDQKLESCNGSKTEEEGPDSHPGPESQHIPLVKTSAVTRVGLQELLELIDEKLVQIDKEQLSSRKVQEKGEFDRKWRPTQAENVSVAME